MANSKLTVVLTGEDGLTPVIDRAGNEIDGLGKKTENYSRVVNNLKGVIREERQEARMRNFALRESAGAVQQLSDVFVGPSGLGKAVQTGLGSMFEFDFALKSVGALGESAGGSIGKIAGAIGGIALPASIALGAFALIKSSIEEDKKATEELAVKWRDLSHIIQNTPVDRIGDLRKELKKAEAEAPDISTWGQIWRTFVDIWTDGNSADEYVKRMGNEWNAKNAGIQAKIIKEQRVEIDGELELVEIKRRLFDQSAEFMNFEQIKHTDFSGKRIAFLKEELELLNKLREARAPEGETATEKKIRQGKVDERINKAKSQLNYEEWIAGPIAPMKGLGIDEHIEKKGDKKKKEEAKKLFSMYTEEAKKANEETDKMMDNSIKAIEKEFAVANEWFVGPLMEGVDAIANEVSTGIGSAFEDVFGEANSLLEKFVQSVLEGIARVAMTNLAKQAISGIFSLIPGGGFLSSIFSFHEGGIVPRAHSGAYVNAPATSEFPIMVRGGETIRTEAQERSLQRPTSISINVGTAIGGKQFIRDALSELRRQTGLSIDDLTQDRSGVVSIRG